MFKSLNPSLRLDLALIDGEHVVAEFDGAVWEPIDADSPGSLTLACTSKFEALYAMPNGPYRLEGKLGAERVIARDVWLKSFERVSHPDRKYERPILHLDQVYELELILELSAEAPVTASQVEYFLTPCGLLNPTTIHMRHPDGQVQRDLVHQLSFVHHSLGPIVFDTRHSLVETSPGVRSETSSLCARLTRGVPAAVALNELDAMMQETLAVASFAARYPVRVWGRQVYNEAAHTRTYFQALSSWLPTWDANSRNELVAKQELTEFLESACTSLRQLEKRQRDAVKNALLAAHSEHGTCEDQFRAVFSAFEGLCTVFDEAGSQRLTAADRFRKRKVKKAVADALGKLAEQDPEIDTHKIIRMLERTANPPELRFKRFAGRFAVEYSDLWPAYGRGRDFISLYDIRNRLAHGSLFEVSALSAVHAALLHLRLLLERCVLRVLGWKVERSNSSPRRVAAFVDSEEMQLLQQSLAAASASDADADET